MSTSRAFASAAAAVVLAAAAPAQSGTATAAPGYSLDVRPILAENCFRCHGPDEAAREADLRLDVAGHGRERELLRRVTSQDRAEVMPPPHANKTLTAAEIATLRRWVAAGAAYEPHWSFVPPVRPRLPEPVGGAAAAHPVDRFVRARLVEHGLTPSPPADRATLVRRLYLDLIGLPPTPAQAAAFVDDDAPDAYQRLVDELLASPHYGERQARRWLDLARYADSNGYEKDRPRTIWPYRDWVVRACNDDLPFDRFAIEQLAGDLLPEPTADQLIATGFHRNTMLNEEGGIDPLEFRYHAMTDRVATTGAVFLGLTIGCAQCHTHKFDPITHREYFGLMAFLDNADEPDFVVPDAAADERRRRNLAQADEELARLWREWPADAAPREQRFAEWLAARRARAVAWRTLVPTDLASNLPTLQVEGDGAVFASGDSTKHDIYRLSFAAAERPVTALRLEALPDPRLPDGGPGMTYYEGRKGDFFLSEFAARVGHGDAARTVAIARASESYASNQYSQMRASAALACDGDLQTGWSTHLRNGERHVAVFVPAAPIAAGQPFSIELQFGRHFASSLGRFRLSATSADGGAEALALPFDHDGALERALRLDPAARTAEQRQALRGAFVLEAEETAKDAQQVRRLRSRAEHVTTLILRERPPGHRRVTHRRHRGEYLQPREVVAPHLPAALRGDAPAPQDRLAFARWLVSRDNPLAARVLVNREWAALFGRGLVATLDDFGAQGERPTHPELLDWLAVEFMARGWSRKQLHRLLVTSETYRQSSDVRAGDHTRDPDNRWLARASRLRLEAEQLRDAALVAAGVLSPELHGPPVRPPQPPGVTEVAFGSPKWRASDAPARFRRSLYTFQKRTAPFAFYATFDAPSGEACTARRHRSNTPLQALALLNDPMMVELAEALGARLAEVATEHGVDEALRRGFGRVLTREPGARELAALRAFFENARSRDSARSRDNAPSPDNALAWAAVARALLCLDEAITRN